MRYNFGLLALALGTFSIGVTEFAPMGLLPVIATDIGVSIPRAGLLVSAYALGVVLGAPLMTLAADKVARRTFLIALIGIFTFGNVLAAVSGSYTALLVARIVTSLSQGAFFGVGAVVATGLVPANRRAGAVSMMFMGLSLSNVAGVPFATWAGGYLGWRSSFWGIAGLGVITMAALRLTLPALPVAVGSNALKELRALTSGPVLRALALTVIAASAMFTVFTYIVPILHGATHASPGFVTAMLVNYGLGLTAGNWLGGKLADRSVDLTLLTGFATVIAALIAFSFLMPYSLPTAVIIFIWGTASFILVPPLQIQVITAAADAPSLASSVNIGAFNLGNAAGAALGGAVIAANLGNPAIMLAGAAMSTLGLAFFARTRTMTPKAPV